MHTFSPAKAWIGGLNILNKPLLHLHTQASRELPWATIDMDYMNLNQAAHGDREFGFIETRMRLDRATVSGHASDPEVVARIAVWARAAIGWNEVQHLKVARFGDNMRDVAVTEGDKVQAQIQFGVSVNTYGVTELVDAVAKVSDSVVDEVVREYEDSYEMALDLRRGGDRHAAVRYDYAAFSRRADSELSQPTLRTWVGFANFLESPYKDSWLMATVLAVRVTGNRPS